MESFKIYFKFIKPYWKLVIITILIGMVKFGIPLTLPLIMKYIIDDLLLSSISTVEKSQKLIEVLLGAFVLFVVIRAPIEYLRQYFAQLTTSRILYDLRSHLYSHIQKLSLRYYQNHKTGEIISRMINDAEQTKSIVETGLMNVWIDLFTLTIAIGFMIHMDFWLTIVAIAVFPFYAFSVKQLYKKLRMLTKARSQSLAEMQGYLHERVNGMPVIKSFTLETVEKDRFGEKNNKFLDRALALTKWNAATNSIINTLTDIAPLLVLAYGGYQVIQGNLTVGAFIAFYAFLDRLYNPLRRLINSSTELTQASASLDRVIELMNEPYDIVDSLSAKPVQEIKGKIDFENVSFKYDTASEWVLKNIQLSIQSGETIAFVGMSGGGKSSLISLLPRFYDIQEGSILIDHTDIKDITIKSLRDQIGMVLQDNILFSGTVRENILFGKPDATEEEVIHAAEAANAHDFILNLPGGYDTEIGERGVKLSGGQKQRVAIARVFLKDPSILVLDEATSALDLESEHLIQESLAKLAKDRTTLIVAHRLSTITHADQIVLIENGQIREKGTHDQLMKEGGAYFRLFNVQNLNGVHS
ncbi:ABC transporter ATP-binding protein [Paenibacillus alginolyticus]|uniref:ABC transporter ATP-binding protein/permease n=1 Tax=Paenibacillus alginolyticus TaxID=59839 RepID=A0ABT4GB55_9BACL|nr:ABC transporter ATP-binding protein [Paenibacillus alginolyticus]MCY9693419.1 ABC transporter ATP-binding protein/permease [Paenibacillus alginolyticus]MEC0144679.1 ABC transporter ATP-binding protein [Paenibacillus alginolyticus]